MSNFTFGLDPEFMISNKDKFSSAINYLPKNESNKRITKDGSSFYYDNVLAEIAVKPARNKNQAIENTRKSLRYLSEILEEGDAKFVIQAYAEYPQTELKSIESRIVSCNPEWEAYNLTMMLPPDDDIEMIDGYYQFKHNRRTAGGHIHLGIWDLESENLSSEIDVLHIVRMMDLFVAIPSLFLDTDLTSKMRRKVYGKAGTHRIPEHGVEYRTLSNFWLSSPELFGLIYDLSAFAVDFVMQGSHKKFWHTDEKLLEDDVSLAFKCSGYDVKCLQNCINLCDHKQAEKFMLFVSNYLPSNLVGEIERLSNKRLQDPYQAWSL